MFAFHFLCRFKKKAGTGPAGNLEDVWSEQRRVVGSSPRTQPAGSVPDKDADKDAESTGLSLRDRAALSK